MKYFTISELTKSDTAKQFNIDNTPSPVVVDNLEKLINNCLDPIRAEWGSPIIVTSGYRCRDLNTKVKGAFNSHHMFGFAADIKAGNQEDNKKLFDLIRKMQKEGRLQFTQLIDEYNYTWIHISYWENNLINKIIHTK